MHALCLGAERLGLGSLGPTRGSPAEVEEPELDYPSWVPLVTGSSSGHLILLERGESKMPEVFKTIQDTLFDGRGVSLVFYHAQSV